MKKTDTGINILYEDGDIIVVEKPYGISSQTERGSSQDMVSLLMNYFHQSAANQVSYVGVVHRLDKNTGGVMVYAKNKSAAAKLSSQISDREAVKKYYAVIYHGEKLSEKGMMRDFLIRDGKTNTSRVASENEKNNKAAKKAELSYKLIGSADISNQSLYLADITLHTGRHHQIRVQFSHRGCPLVGDRKYGGGENIDGNSENKCFENFYPEKSCLENKGLKNLGLYCYSMTFKHPVSGKLMTFEKKPENSLFNMFNLI